MTDHTPTRCPECRKRFMREAHTQAEMRMIALKDGPQAAEAELNERWMEWHDGGHGDD